MGSFPDKAVQMGIAKDYYRAIGQLKEDEPVEKVKEEIKKVEEEKVEIVQEIEENNKKFTCEICGFKTDYKVALAGHMRTHK